METRAHEPPLLRVADLAKRYRLIQALDGVSLELRRGEIHGLCGHNGAGKSTLVKVLAGLVQPDGGSVALDGRTLALRSPAAAQAEGIAIVDQELSVVPTLSVQENIHLGDIRARFFTGTKHPRAAARGALELVGLQDRSLTEPVSRLAIGERQLIEVARALNRGARLLIMDEPTATLSTPEIERVFAAVRRVAAAGRGVVFVSHRLDEVLTLCHRVTVLRDGRVAGTHGIEDLDRSRLIELLLGEAGVEKAASRRPAASAREARPVAHVEIRGLRVGNRLVPTDLDLTGGRILGLAGQVGSGATDLLRALAGLAVDVEGAVSVDGRRVRPRSVGHALGAGIAYLSSDRKGEGLFLGRCVAENLVSTRLPTLGRAGLVGARRMNRVASGLARLVGVDGHRLSAPVADLSGGNQQKVFLGRCLEREDVQVMLLDEPTRGVDVGGRAEIHELIRGFAAKGNAVAFASTELDELFDLADLIATLFEGRIVSIRPRSEFTPATLLAEMTAGAAAA
jgi:ABC-type sugar transport system ATPase subunit